MKANLLKASYDKVSYEGAITNKFKSCL